MTSKSFIIINFQDLNTIKHLKSIHIYQTMSEWLQYCMALERLRSRISPTPPHPAAGRGVFDFILPVLPIRLFFTTVDMCYLILWNFL